METFRKVCKLFAILAFVPFLMAPGHICIGCKELNTSQMDALGIVAQVQTWEKATKRPITPAKVVRSLFASADKDKSGKLDMKEISGGLGCVVKNAKTNACTWSVVPPKVIGTKIGHPLLGEIRLRE